MDNLNPEASFIPTTIPIPRYKYTPLAKAYIIFQKLDKLFPIEEGHNRGTIFPDLYIPYDFPGIKGRYDE